MRAGRVSASRRRDLHDTFAGMVALVDATDDRRPLLWGGGPRGGVHYFDPLVPLNLQLGVIFGEWFTPAKRLRVETSRRNAVSFKPGDKSLGSFLRDFRVFL